MNEGRQLQFISEAQSTIYYKNSVQSIFYLFKQEQGLSELSKQAQEQKQQQQEVKKSDQFSNQQKLKQLNQYGNSSNLSDNTLNDSVINSVLISSSLDNSNAKAGEDEVEENIVNSNNIVSQDQTINSDNSTLSNTKKIKEIVSKYQYKDKTKDNNQKNIFPNKKKSIDISHFLPPANPLPPKIYSEEYSIFTAINTKFEKLPEFNKFEKYSFLEPMVTLKSLDQIQEKLSSEKNRTLFEYHNSIRDKLVYERHPDQNLLQKPTKMNDTIYFSSIICKLNKLLNVNKKVFLQEQLKKGYDLSKTIKDSVLKRKLHQMEEANRISKTIDTTSTQNYTDKQQATLQQSSINTSQHKQQLQDNNFNQQKMNTKTNIILQCRQMKQTIDLGQSNSINESTVDCNSASTNNQIGNNTSILTNTIITSEIDKQQNDANPMNSVINSVSSNSGNQITSCPLQQETLPLVKDSLIFSSQFESGNLFSAYQVSENNYELILQNDINTKGNTQWFFFKVSNTKKNQTVTFTLLNLQKTGSLFNNGLCPVTFSEKRNKETGQEWMREGQEIRYYKNNIFRDGFRTNKFYSSLTFQYTFEYNQDSVYFAHSYPYTYSDLQEDFNKIMNDKEKSQYVSRKNLCTTLSGNMCDSLTITSTNAKKRGQRKGIVIFSRQHPGETGGSYMMKGIIDFLLSNTPQAEFLRDACIFKIVPMVNPDGVIHGNYRCDLAGVDLNRRWKKPNKKLHPTVYSIKEMIKKLHSEREIKLILDLHGHSRKMEAFFYGCNYREDPLKTRIFPFLLSKINQKISFGESRFSIDSYKESTARITLWRELRVPNVFTLEASFFGYKQQINGNNQKTDSTKKDDKDQSCINLDNQEAKLLLKQKLNKDIILNQKQNEQSVPKKNIHFTIQDYFDIGRDICINLHNLIQQESASKENKGGFLIDENSNLHGQLKEIDANLLDTGNQSSSGSDSNPSEDDLDDEEMLEIIPKNVLNKKQKQILNDKLKKEKNKKLNKIKTQSIPEQPITQQQEIKRKQTNQMYLQRYLQKQQEKNAQNKEKIAVTKKDQEQQTDSSFLYDMYLYMENKRQLTLNKSDLKESIMMNNTNISTLNNISNNQNSNTQISNTNPSQITNNNFSTFSVLQNNKNKVENHHLPNVSSSQPISQLNQDQSPLIQRPNQSQNDEYSNTSQLEQRSPQKVLKKGQSQYGINNIRVKSLDQSKQPLKQNGLFSGGVQEIINQDNQKIDNSLLGQQSQRQAQRGVIPNSSIVNSNNIIANNSIINNNNSSSSSINAMSNNQNFPSILAIVNENQIFEENANNEQLQSLAKIRNGEITERRREVSMSFSHTNNVGIIKSNYGPNDHAFNLLDNSKLENSRSNSNILHGPSNKQNVVVVSSYSNSDSKNNIYKSTISSIKKNDSKIILKDGQEIVKIKQLYNQMRSDQQQYYNSADLGSHQNNSSKQSIFSNIEKNDTSNKLTNLINNNYNAIQQQQTGAIGHINAFDIINNSQRQDLNNGGNSNSGMNSFLPKIGSPKQNINYSNSNGGRYQNDQIITSQFQYSSMAANFSKQLINNNNNINNNSNTNNSGKITNLAMMSSIKKNQQNLQSINQPIQTKTNFQRTKEMSKSQSVQILLKARQNMQNK